MKIRCTFLAALGLFVSGCGQQAATPAAPAGPREIDLTAGDNMKYDVTAIAATPGEDLKVVLTNTGSMPLNVMGHDWVLLKAGSDPAAFSQAAMLAKDTDYMPPSLKDEVIASIGLLGPRKSGEADFKAPTTPGDYPYLCTFPAHYLNGMHGVLTVK